MGFRLRLVLSWMGYWERGRVVRGEPKIDRNCGVFAPTWQLPLVTRPRGFDLRGQDLNFTPYLPQCFSKSAASGVKKATSTLMHSAKSSG